MSSSANDRECSRYQSNQLQHDEKNQQTEYIASGAGYFTSKFFITKGMINYISPLAIESIKCIPVKAGNTFTIAEYGCADGGTSMPLMYACVENLRKLYGNHLEIHIIYEDKAENDFNSIFYILQGLLPGPSSYLTDFPNVFVSANGTMFYDQCFPSGSVNFGFSSFAVHWLSRKPCNLTKAVLHSLSEVPDERNEFSRQAEEDWERFLLLRAKELSMGGRMALIVCICGDDKESNYVSFSPMYFAMYKVWESMAKDNIFTEKELQQMTIPEYFRTGEELAKPFMSDKSPVRKAGLTLVSLETKEFPLPEKKLWEETGDAKMAAKLAAEQIRAWSNSFYSSTLDDLGYSPEKKTDILNEYFYRLEEEYLRSPEDYMKNTIWGAFIIIEKSKFIKVREPPSAV